ncbi:MAG TPA: squalene/phytoene synthase family protein [Acidimicrobiales bacterium]|nr:squalene/phytoene synthase family protein [Acidimicrobiales bacterium]
MNLELAYKECEEITRREAKNFAYGIRLLRPPERQALSAVYALARRIDDIGDGDLPPAQKLSALAEVRQAVAALASADDPVLVAVADARRRYDLPLGAFGELIDGCEMDVLGTSYRTFDELVVYCRRVAGSVGRLSLAVFGASAAPRATALADDLGVALQLTNILRDVVEDRDRGRVYLPSADAEQVACPSDLRGPPEPIAALVALECARAHEWFARGLELLPLLNRRSRACVSAMAGIYRRLLLQIEGSPIAVTERRVSVPTSEKLWVAARSLAGATW